MVRENIVAIPPNFKVLLLLPNTSCRMCSNAWTVEEQGRDWRSSSACQGAKSVTSTR